MRVLLLHPEDKFSPVRFQGWDLIVDLSRAPAATYEAWSKQAGCRVVSLADYARGFEDLYRVKQTIDHGKNLVVDKFGIDWWNVLLPMLNTELERSLMLVALAGELGNSIELYASRPDARASALQKFLGIECLPVKGGGSAFGGKMRHYQKAFSHLDLNQLTQIVQDKFDPEHSIRRRFKRKRIGKDQPLFLLPTAYINVSRTAIAYATVLAEEQFLLVVARPGGKLAPLPDNVRMISLDAYFDRTDKAELASLTKQWGKLRSQLMDIAPELRMAEALGMFQRGPELMQWGLAARDAWIRLFASERVAGCLSADDVNPYTSLPLFIAGQRGIPTLAVHHGALDSRMATKTLCADFYLAKGELEHDYLLESCRMDTERIVIGGPPQVLPGPATPANKPWLVFFTEPYANLGWRIEQVYEDLMPRLYAVTRQCGLKLVFKLHPFESIKGHKNLIRKLLPRDQFEEIQWIAGPPTPELWGNTQFAMTVESTIALECAVRQVPIFLCGWLQNVYGGYLRQYAKFGVGHILNSPNEMQNIPQLLTNWGKCESAARGKIWQTIGPAELRNLLSGSHRRGSIAPTQIGA